jgi:cell surface protein SprA
MEVKSNTITPQYDPARGDIEVQSLLETIDANEELTDAEKQERKDLIVEQSQTYRFTRSFTSRLQKRGSRSRLLRNTIDGTSISYSYTDQDGRSPNSVLNDSWQWNTAVDYRLNVPKPRVFRPFGFLGDLPIIGALGGLNFNYLPNSLSLGASATRRYAVTKERPDPLRNPLPDALGAELTEAELDLISGAVFPLRPQHTFTHRRQFGLQYNPFGFLNLSFDTNTDQNLNDLGSIVDSTTVLIDDGVPVLDNRPISALLADSTITRQDIGATAFSQQDLQVRPVDNVINDILGGNTPRTERYESRINTTFRPRLDKIKALNWMSLQDVGYGTTFTWRNGSVDNNLGATIGTTVTLRGGVTLRPKNMFEKFGLYRSIQEDQKAAEQAAQQRRQEREQAKQERKAERERQREQERLLEEARQQAEAEAEARGEELPEDPPVEEPLPEDPPVEEPAEEEEEVEEVLPVLTPEGEDVATEETAADTTESEGGGFRLPLPNPVSLMRQLFLGVTGIDDFRLTYNGSRRSESTNVGRIDENGETLVNYSLLDAAFRDQGPSLGYRFGLDREIDPEQRIISERVQVTDAFTDQNRFQGSTRLSLTSTLQVNLTWNVEWTERDNITYRTIDTTSTTMTGDNKASVWAFGASYIDLINKQLATFRRDAVNQDSLGNMRSTVLTNASVSSDFLSSYMTSLGSLGQDGRLPFPLPGWQVTYSGISKWPLIRSLTQTASLRHGYSADYGLDFRSNLSPNPTGEFNLQDGPTIIYDVSPIEVGAVRVNERFQPLIGLDLTFKGNIQTSLAWNTGTSYALTTTTNQVSETETSEITVTANYQKQGLSLPFLPGKRLNNRIGFSLTLSRSTNNDRNFNIKNALEEAASRGPDEEPFQPEEVLIAGSDFGVQVLTSQSRITVAPKITYQFSNRVSADAFVRYENFKSEDGRRPPTTNINGGFNVRVSISN